MLQLPPTDQFIISVMKVHIYDATILQNFNKYTKNLNAFHLS